MHCGIYARDGFLVAQALAKGCREVGLTPRLRSLSDWQPNQSESFGLVFIFGLRGKGAAILKEYPDAYVVDYGYLNRVMDERNFTTGHWQISQGGLNRPTRLQCDADRFTRLGLQIQPMKEKRSPRVLCAQSVGDAAHPFDTKEKLYSWVRSVPHDEYRPHPQDSHEVLEPLDEFLKVVGTVVTWNSTIGIDALLAGVHVEAHGPACYKGIRPHQRSAFFNRLAYSQWTMTEMSMGLPLQRILYERTENPL